MKLNLQKQSTRWPKIPLGDLVDFLDSQRKPIKASERTSGPYPYYGANGLQDHVDGYLFDEKLVLLAEDGGYFFDPTRPITYIVEGKCWVNNHAHVLRARQQVIPEFLNFQLGFADLKTYLSGSTRAKLTKGDASRITVICPSILEQRRIVDILSRAEGIVRLRCEAEKKAAELIPALFFDMFGDPASNPKGWPSAPLRDLCDVRGGGTPSKQNPAFWIGEIPWVSPKDMSGVDTIEDAEDHISLDALKNSATNLIPVGSVLIVTRSGVLKHTIPCALTSREVAINQDIKAFVPHKEIEPHFLLSQLQIRAKEVLGLVRVGATVQNIETEALKRMRFIYPSLDAQVKFSEKCEQIRSIQSQQSVATSTAQATFAALLSQVFTHP